MKVGTMFVRNILEKYSYIGFIADIIIIGVISFLIHHRRLIYLTWKYPKVRGFVHVPLFGHLGVLSYINPSMQNFMKLCDYLTQESGRMIYAGGIRNIMVSKVEHLEVVLTHPNTQQKHYIYDFFEGFVGDSIFRIGGKQWKRNRKAMAPTMHHEAVAPHTEDMCKCVSKMADRWESNVGRTFDAMPDLAKCIIEMFAKASFGVDLNVQENGTKLDHYTDLFLELSMYRVMAVIKHPDFIYRWTKDYKIQQEALKYGHGFTDQIFEERKAIYDEEQTFLKDEASTNEKDSPRKRKFIDHLFDLSKETNFTPKQVKDEVNTFMIAGFDTCTSGVSFTLLTLAMHQDIQKMVYEELIDILGPDRHPEYSDLSKLVYLEQVIKETMRLFPPAPIIARVAEEEFNLDAHVVPKGTQLGIYLLKTHRSELYWKDPLKFDPERFSSKELGKQHKYSYIPFLAGPRTCFGTRVAWITLKCSIATLLRRYRFFTPFESVEEIKLGIKMTLKAEDGILLSFQERETKCKGKTA